MAKYNFKQILCDNDLVVFEDSGMCVDDFKWMLDNHDKGDEEISVDTLNWLYKLLKDAGMIRGRNECSR